jgi:hypothetical protein
MIKYVLFFIILCHIPTLSICQNQPPFDAEKEVERIDLKLEKFRSQHQQGAFITLLGGIISTVPSISQGKPIMSSIALGSFVTAIGILTTLNSYKYLKHNSQKTTAYK